MLTISSGHSATYLTDAVAAGRENYYTGAVAAGEPPGRWYGTGAEGLGLSGLVDPQHMTALYEHFVDPHDPGFREPAAWAEAGTLGHRGRRYVTEDELYKAALDAEPKATPERRAELRLDAGKRARKNVAFLDATFSVQKSITVLHTAFEAQEVKARAGGDNATADAWAAHRSAVEDAIWAGNQAGMDYLAAHAGYSRIGHHGGAAGRYVDAHDLVIASFLQHDSRNHDPQLHIHNAILNRVQGADGVWRTLDGRGLYAHRGAAAAVAERTTEEHLARSLGVRFAARPDGKAREVLGVPTEVMELFSSRRRAITAKTADLVEAFETRTGRAPNGLELDRLQRQATFATRKAKSHEGESAEARLDRWDAELRAEIAGGLHRVAHDVLDLAGEPGEPQRWSRRAVIDTALADVQSRKAAWTAPDLTRAISDALPDRLGDLTGADVSEMLDGLTDEALTLAVPIDADRPGADAVPDALRLADGTCAYDAPGRCRYATPDHVHTERLLAAAGTADDGTAHSRESAEAFLGRLLECGIELSADQVAAVRGVLTSGARVECLVGPAGTGKSFVLGAIAKAWHDHPESGRVVGLASSQIATEVLAGEGLTARNVTRWLSTQARLTDADTTGRGARPDDEAWRIQAGDLVVVDESAMTGTADLAAVHARVHAAGGKLLLTGDHRQLAAVGAAGGMELVATSARTYELTEARRFSHGWEAAASLRLRGGDPAALGEYHKHGRLLDCGTAEAAEASAARAWLADTLAGRHAVLVVDTNEAAARVAAALRADLVRLGRVTDEAVPIADGACAGVGDLVQARANGWHLAGVDGNRRGPINRELLRVLEVNDDGSLRAGSVIGRGPDGETHGEHLNLPADYARDHLALGYACTAHAAQGRTVDASHVVVGPGTSAAGLYVGLSRGREANTAHVITRSVPADAPPGAAQEAVHRNPVAVLAGAFEAAEDAPTRSALAELADSSDRARSARTAVELLADATDLATAGRSATWLDELVHDGHLRGDQRAALAAEDGAATLDRALRRAELAGHDPRECLRAAVTIERGLDDARNLTNVIRARLSADAAGEPVGDTFTERLPQIADPQWSTYLTELAAAADDRTRELGAVTAAQPPQWAREAFGPVPDDPDQRADWTRRAGTVAAHRELTGHDDPAAPLGAAPKPGQTDAAASWHAAWRALGREEAGREEAQMSTGQLRIRIRAWEREQTWQPRYVANDLAGTSAAANAQRATSALRGAEADTAADESDRARLREEAEEAAALADLLEARAVDLSDADHVRALWYAHTAGTRTAAERAAHELTARDDQSDDEPATTAEEWLTAHREADAAEDPHRQITDDRDLAHIAEEQKRHLAALDDPVTERVDRSADEPAAVEPSTVEEVAEAVGQDAAPDDEVRVPSAEETASTLRRARAALAEIECRDAADQARAAEERAEQLARWHTHDRAAAAADTARGADHALERAGGFR